MESVSGLPYPNFIDRRAFQRSIGLRILPSGHVKITAGKTVSHRVILNFLFQSEPWIERGLRECQKFKELYPLKEFREGESFLLRGQEHFLRLWPRAHKRPQFRLFPRRQLILCLPEGGVHRQELLSALRRFYKKLGCEQLRYSLDKYSCQMNLCPKSLSFRSQKTRWGSCSSDGNMSLNWKLIAAPLECLEYVVIHELAHLRHQNHSKDFWRLVEEYCPQRKVHSQWLKKNHYAFDFLAKKSELHGESLIAYWTSTL